MKNDLVIEIDKNIQVHGAKLEGTLCLPAATKPEQVVLMICGSGEVDAHMPALIIDWQKPR